MYFFSHNPGLREPDGSLTPRYSLPPRNGAFGFGGRPRPQGFKSGGRQIIAGAEAASAAKSPVTDEKRKEAPPNGGPTEGRRMGLSHGHLSALRIPRRGSRFFSFFPVVSLLTQLHHRLLSAALDGL